MDIYEYCVEYYNDFCKDGGYEKEYGIVIGENYLDALDNVLQNFTNPDGEVDELGEIRLEKWSTEDVEKTYRFGPGSESNLFDTSTIKNIKLKN